MFSRASSSTLKREAPRRGAISMHFGAFSAGNQIFAAGEPLCWCQGRQALECWALGCRVWGRLAGPSAGLCAALGAWLLVAGSGCGFGVWLGPVRAGSGGSAWRLPECGAGWSGQPSPREPLEGWVALRWDAFSLAVACVGCALLARAHMQPHLGLQGRVCLRHAVGVLVVLGCAPRRFPDRFSCRCFVPGRCWVRGVSQTF